mmetsp:Transcript_8397/g.15852  ORF Transcript_8397/g.15852 Transcript_8397/m.15852 type:complete len:91 (+) Transcript_8397:2512-2784(+)
MCTVLLVMSFSFIFHFFTHILYIVHKCIFLCISLNKKYETTSTRRRRNTEHRYLSKLLHTTGWQTSTMSFDRERRYLRKYKCAVQQQQNE